MVRLLEIGNEIHRAKDSRGQTDYDGVRRKYMRALEAISGRPLLVYASSFLQPPKGPNAETVIEASDLLGIQEATMGLTGPNLDVMIHSPGGSAEAAESIVSYLRSRFTHIRFIVPFMAKSAATMMCCAGDEVILAPIAELGPIDPQIRVILNGSMIYVPAQSIKRQFERAKESLRGNPAELPAWIPILQSLGPSLLDECDIADELSERLVRVWLARYMLKDDPNQDQRAPQIAKFLAQSSVHLTHGRRIGMDDLRQQGMRVVDLSSMPEFSDAVQRVYHCVHWTLEETGAYKIFESVTGGAYFRSVIPPTFVPLDRAQELPRLPALPVLPQSPKKKRPR